MASEKDTYHIKFQLRTHNNNEHDKKLVKTNLNGVLNEEDYQDPDEEKFVDEPKDFTKGPIKLVWPNITVAVTLHLIFLYGINELLVRRTIPFLNFFGMYMYGYFTNIGVAAGAHRLWAHRSYKATLPLRIFLMIWQTLAMQNSLYIWVRDHRSHHKWTETHADPHNAKRGFFFAHMGWLFCKKHPDVKSKTKLIDMSDLENDPVVMWQFRNYIWLAILGFFVVPTVIFSYLYNWSIIYTFATASVTRYVITLHLTWLINSAAHLIGPKPYDKDVYATESIGMQFLGVGEGFHNYHHVFPWDYKAAEWRGIFFNGTKAFIDVCAFLGLAYDLKTVPSDVVQRRVIKKGDGTHPVWGWGDKSISKQDVMDTKIVCKKLN